MVSWPLGLTISVLACAICLSRFVTWAGFLWIFFMTARVSVCGCSPDLESLCSVSLRELFRSMYASLIRKLHLMQHFDQISDFVVLLRRAGRLALLSEGHLLDERSNNQYFWLRISRLFKRRDRYLHVEKLGEDFGLHVVDREGVARAANSFAGLAQSFANQRKKLILGCVIGATLEVSRNLLPVVSLQRVDF